MTPKQKSGKQVTDAKIDLWVLRAQSGDKRAFEAIYRHYNQPLRRFAFRVSSDEQLAKDAVQEAWLTLSRNLKSLKDPRGFKVWAYRTVRWRVVDMVRRRGIQGEQLPEELAEDVPNGLAGSSAVSQHATPDQLRAHLSQLPSDEKQALALFYLEEMKVTEIAAILEIPVGTVKSRLNRARNRLRQQMSGE